MQQDHLGFLCDIGELSAALAGSLDIETFLGRLDGAIARQLDADVSSIYLYDEGSGALVLRATHGLSPEAVGNVSIPLGEGLVGTALKELRPLIESEASKNPNYRHVPGLGEEKYESFIAVPVLRGTHRIGVITAQREQKKCFTEEDVAVLRAVAAQLAGTIENVRTIMMLRSGKPEEDPLAPAAVFRGRGTSPGWGYGGVYHLGRVEDAFELAAEDDSIGLTDFRRALDATEVQIQELQTALAQSVPEAASLILDAHLMMLRDSGFTGIMETEIEQGKDVCHAIREVTHKYAGVLSRSNNAYMREKEGDVLDVGRRLLSNVLHLEDVTESHAHTSVVVAPELYPSDIVKLSVQGVQGIVLASGGETTHVSILARSLQIPMVIAEDHRLLTLDSSAHVLVDGDAGTVYIEPEPEVVHRFDAIRRARDLTAHRDVPAVTVTRDGQPIHLLANINLLQELRYAVELKVEGIGLYRTEFPFMIRTSFPSEEEQYGIYCKLVDGMGDGPVTFRTLDIGGEKALAYYDHGEEANPELGLRSIRFALRHPELLVSQCRAILRAGAGHRQLRIMFPMIASIDELRSAKAILQTCIDELVQEGQPCHKDPAVGMMIELPSVLPLLDAFADEADFFSVGTNDFVQYMLAADRGNHAVSEYYCPHHPAVLRGLADIMRIATKHGREVSICGEMAHQTRYLKFLIGIGSRTFSVDPHYICELREAISEIDVESAGVHAGQLLKASTLAETEALLIPGALPV